MGVMNRFKDMFKGEDEYDVDGYNDGYDSYDDVADEGGVNESVQAQPQPAARDMRSNGGVLSASALEMKVIKPDRFEAVTQIAEHLLAHKTVVLNLEETNKETIRRIIDFMSGVAFAIEGNIKRVAQALDARAYTIFPSPAPTKPELLHPHLWRYWTRLPKAGHVGIYDRSWYGRVLVERVEGFASVSEWTRAYDEINEFERDLVRWGAILLKFWVDVSPEEQLRRFRDREQDPAKQWKITDEDWRNRDKYPQYKAAVEDIFRLTSTPFAPWIILESDDKRYARVKALKIINDALEARLREN